MIRRAFIAAATMVVIALLTGACAGAQDTTAPPTPAAAQTNSTATASPTSTGECIDSPVADLVAETEGLDPAEREAFLLERAAQQNEGDLSLYAEISGEDAEAIAELFEAQYEGLTLNTYRAGSDDVRQRLLEEADAGFRGADVIEIEALEMVILDDAGVLAPSTPPLAQDVIEAGQFENFTADKVEYLVPAWNTGMIDEGDVPAGFADLADDRFAGTLALEDSDVYWFAVMVQHLQETEGITEEEAINVFRNIAANGAITSGHTATLELVVAGQYGITPNAYVHRIEEYKEEGAPVEWLPVNVPVVAEVTAVAVACQPTNPAGALLLQDFFLSPDGVQSYYSSVNRTPSNQALHDQAFGEGEDFQPVRADVTSIVRDYAHWADLWNDVVLQAASQ